MSLAGRKEVLPSALLLSSLRTSTVTSHSLLFCVSVVCCDMAFQKAGERIVK